MDKLHSLPLSLSHSQSKKQRHLKEWYSAYKPHIDNMWMMFTDSIKLKDCMYEDFVYFLYDNSSGDIYK